MRCNYYNRYASRVLNLLVFALPVAALTAAALLGTAPAAFAQALLSESFETPAIAAGTSSPALPAGWQKFSGGSANSQVVFPTGTSQFNQTNPLSAPATGNQLLQLTGANTGVAYVTSTSIQASFDYTLSAAIGNSMVEANDTFWSLQLWADTNNNGIFDGSASDAFIGQEFGTSGSGVNAPAGEWASNSFTFTAPTSNPSITGKNLIVFLNNFATGTSYYDSVTVTAAAAPEPATLALLATGLLPMAGLVMRRRHSRKTTQ